MPRATPSNGHSGHDSHDGHSRHDGHDDHNKSSSWTTGAARARSAFREGGHIVIVGASLAGLTAAETLRAEGFAGRLTFIGDEPYKPYDRPPLSKEVPSGWFSVEHTQLPRHETLTDVAWRLGVAATGLDMATKRVYLADGDSVPYDRLLITTGARARPWPNPAEAALDGVLTVRTRDDAARLRERLVAKPRRVLIIGGGFTGSEIASVCRELDLPVTLTERGTAPLVGALGGPIAEAAARLQRQHGVDLRTRTTVTALEGDAQGRFRRAQLSDGSAVEADVAVVALGAICNTEWLGKCGLGVGSFGVACEASCRAIDINAIVVDDVFVAGDVARFPHPLFNYQFMTLEHWGNAVEQAQVAAHNMICAPIDRRPYVAVPVFWSSQFGVNIKSVGVPTDADAVVVAQGSLESASFIAVYGKGGRVVAAVACNQAKWLDYYQLLIERAALFPPDQRVVDQPTSRAPVPAGFPDARGGFREATVVLTGHDPNEQRVEWVPHVYAASSEHATPPATRAPAHA